MVNTPQLTFRRHLRLQEICLIWFLHLLNSNDSTDSSNLTIEKDIKSIRNYIAYRKVQNIRGHTTLCHIVAQFPSTYYFKRICDLICLSRVAKFVRAIIYPWQTHPNLIKLVLVITWKYVPELISFYLFRPSINSNFPSWPRLRFYVVKEIDRDSSGSKATIVYTTFLQRLTKELFGDVSDRASLSYQHYLPISWNLFGPRWLYIISELKFVIGGNSQIAQIVHFNWCEDRLVYMFVNIWCLKVLESNWFSFLKIYVPFSRKWVYKRVPIYQYFILDSIKTVVSTSAVDTAALSLATSFYIYFLDRWVVEDLKRFVRRS